MPPERTRFSRAVDRFVPDRLVSLKLVPCRKAIDRSALARLAPFRDRPLRSAQLRSAPWRSAPFRSWVARRRAIDLRPVSKRRTTVGAGALDFFFPKIPTGAPSLPREQTVGHRNTSRSAYGTGPACMTPVPSERRGGLGRGHDPPDEAALRRAGQL